MFGEKCVRHMVHRQVAWQGKPLMLILTEGLFQQDASARVSSFRERPSMKHSPL